MRKGRPILLLLCTISFSCHRQTQFELRNVRGLKENPAGVKFVLRTPDRRSTFHLYETIPIELAFSSEELAAYSIELDESMNSAGPSTRFVVSSTDSVFVKVGDQGIECCESRRRYLSPKEVTLKRELTDYLRFEKPGTYSVFMATNRIFPQLDTRSNFGRSKLTVTSNILILHILPDNPQWDAQQLSSDLQRLRDPQIQAQYSAAKAHANQQNDMLDRHFETANVVAQTEFVAAQKSLNALDTDEAIQQRVMLMEIESKEDLAVDRQFGGERVFPQPLLASTTRSAAVEAAMRKRAEDPSFGIDYDYFYHWSGFMTQRDHPELFRPGAWPLNRADFFRFHNQAELEVLANLESLVQSKNRESKEVTALTIKSVKSEYHRR